MEYQSAANQIAGKILWTAAAPEYAPTWRLRFCFPMPVAARRFAWCRPRAATTPWSISEFRVYRGEQELPRGAEWRLTAQPYPWGVQDAFDNSLVTFWLCGEKLKPGQFVQVDFHGLQTADSVELEAPPNQWAARWKLEGLGRNGALAALVRTRPSPETLRVHWACAVRCRRNSSAAASTTCWCSTPTTEPMTCV